jgi:tetratricopeptide (TPR) repeat protein
MVCRYDGRHLRMIVLVALVALGFALPVAAQNLVVGKVTDVKGAPVEGAVVTIEQPSSGRKYETKTGKDGTYTQVGLIAGAYSITVTKEGVGTAKGNVNVRGGRVPANFVVGVSAGEGMNKVFNEGVAASAAGNFDEAIAKFNEALKTNPQCADCYYNIGVANAGKKDLDKAEEAYKKSIEVKPTADAYNGLASI